MNVKFDFVVHWLWTIVFMILALSGLGMVSSRFSWIMNNDIASADIVHRILAAVFVVLTLISILYEVIRGIKNDEKRLAWMIIGKSGYQLFTFITTLIFIITGIIIWVCMDTNMAAVAFCLYIHEKLTYLVIGSLIWHIYEKCHALIWPKKPAASQVEKQMVK